MPAEAQPVLVAGDEHSNESRLKAEWNRRLLEEGIYPLLIPAVAELAAAAAVSDAAIRGLTAAIQGSGTFSDSQHHVCSEWQWAYRWRPGRLGWEKIAAGTTVLEIPDPGEAGPKLPGEALPSLADLSETCILVPSSWPRLSAGRSSSWPAAVLTVVLNADPKSLFEGSGQQWAYIRRFVEAAQPASTGAEGTQALAGLLRRTFAGVRTRSLRNLAADVRSVVRQLPANHRIGVPLPANWSEADRQAILSELAGVVLVPEEFDPDDAPGSGRLTAEEVVRLLNVLQPPTQRSKNSSPVRAVLSALQDGAESVLESCAELALWQGELVSADRVAQEVFTYTLLLRARRERVLFAGSAQSAPAATHLASTLANRGIVVLPAETAEILFGKGQIGSCALPGLLSAFEEAPLLAAPDQRIALLRYLLSWHPDQSQILLWRRASRYLLHGDADSLNDTQLLRVQRSGDGSLWVQIVCHGLEQQGVQWRMVPSVLASELLDHQRKQLGVEEIDRRGALEILVEVGPKNFDWTVLMELLAELPDPPPAVIRSLAESAWLPIAAGERRIRPCDTIVIEGLEEEIAHEVATAGGSCLGIRDLADNIRTHPGFTALADKCFPPRPRALALLGELLARHKENLIGDVPVSNENSLTQFIEAFRTAPDVMPAITCLINVARATSLPDCASHLVPTLRKNLSSERLLKIVGFLADQHQKHPANRATLLVVHGWYLQPFSESTEFSTLLSKVRLLSGGHNWKSPEELCVCAANVDPDDLLDKKQAELLKGKVHEPEPDLKKWIQNLPQNRGGILFRTSGQLDSELYESIQALESYFESLMGIDEVPEVVRAIIGGFLCLLGDHERLKQIAQDYLGQRTIEQTRASIGLADLEDKLKSLRLVVEISAGESVKVFNLLGTSFMARLHACPKDLFTGYAICKRTVKLTLNNPSAAYVSLQNSLVVHWFQLRAIDPKTLQLATLKKLLKQTGERVLQEIYGVVDPGFSELLDDISQTDQLDIRVAQNLLLDSAPFYLRQLRLGNQRQLRTILKTWDLAHDQRAEEEEARASGRRYLEKGVKRLQEAKDDFKQLLETETDEALPLRTEILDALRTKLTEYGYSSSSILFELFQNADDAYLQLEQLDTPAELEQGSARLFVVKWSATKITVMHWGRRINYPTGSLAGKDRSYGRDVRNMLALSASDKEPAPAQESVTGKFGLGFKSVFAICDQPRVVSGQLGFKVVGGIYPMRLQLEECDRMRKELALMMNRSSYGTIFELPLRPNGEVCKVMEDVLRPFRESIHVLLAFSRRIKHCRLEIQDSLPETLAWTESPIGSSRNVFVGTLQPGVTNRERQRKALLLRTAFGSFLVPLGVRGLERFGPDLATIWVTAPTGERLDLGFAINGSAFDLDVGRIQLNAKSENNRELAGNLGAEFGKALIELFDAAQGEAGYECFRQALSLAGDCKPYHFWMSVWTLVAEQFSNRSGKTSEANTRDLVRHMLWGKPDCGAWSLYANRQALPTGLDVCAHGVLTNRRQIAGRLTGCLDDENALAMFNLAAAWPKVKSRLAAGTIVSGTRIWKAMEQLGVVDDLQASPVDLAHLIGWELQDNAAVTPERAAIFGAVIKPELLQRLENTSSGLPEAEASAQDIEGARFRSKKITDEPAERLLVVTVTTADERDETRRAAFAPPDRVLSGDYHGAALDFFFACRPASKVTVDDVVDDLIEWGRAAEGAQRAKFLEYINDGDLSSILSRTLRLQTDENDWWRNAEEFQKAAGRTQEIDKGFVRAVVGQTQSERLPETPELNTSLVLDPADVLPRLAKWWRDNRAFQLHKYCEYVYPTFMHTSLTPQHTLSLSMDDLSDDRQGASVGCHCLSSVCHTGWGAAANTLSNIVASSNSANVRRGLMCLPIPS